MKLTVLGTGAWGTALAYALCKDANNSVLMYGKDPTEVNDINDNHRNSRYFDDVVLPDTISATLDAGQALKGAGILLLAVPSSQINNIVDLIVEHCDKAPLIINVIKGFDFACNYFRCFVLISFPIRIREYTNARASERHYQCENVTNPSISSIISHVVPSSHFFHFIILYEGV
jgi:hypothetical protein